jgi:hypothetical protein
MSLLFFLFSSSTTHARVWEHRPCSGPARADPGPAGAALPLLRPRPCRPFPGRATTSSVPLALCPSPGSACAAPYRLSPGRDRPVPASPRLRLARLGPARRRSQVAPPCSALPRHELAGIWLNSGEFSWIPASVAVEAVSSF